MIDTKEVLIATLTLESFPDAIAAYERELLELELRIVPFEAQLQRLDLEIEAQIIEHKSDLTNDTMRREFRLQAQQAFEYQQVINLVRERRTEINHCKINLKHVENRFAVVKIRERQRTAEMALQAARSSVN